jgi:hypothetical protein
MATTPDDDRLARDLLRAASVFTGEVLALASGACRSDSELGVHLEELAAEVAGSVLDAISAWPVCGRQVS